MGQLDEASELPSQIGRYEILSHLATGGMAKIYLAKTKGLGAFERYVVLKTILPERDEDEKFVSMFLDEARLAATLNHQNIAQVYDVDEWDGSYYITMEYVHGENVRAILESTVKKAQPIPFEVGAAIVASAAAGLHHAHERKGKNGQPLNIVHRDVTPSNIMVGFDGGVKVLDFGIAKAEERSTKTQQGTIKGKYGYMSPEQCRGRAIDRRSDVFALGIVLFEITTQRRCFRGTDDFDTMGKIVGGKYAAPSSLRADYPPDLEAIVRKALSPEPEARYQTAQELIEAIDGFLMKAKLTVSSSALSRFMKQMFGDVREPWIDPSARAPVVTEAVDRTEISPMAANIEGASAMESAFDLSGDSDVLGGLIGDAPAALSGPGQPMPVAPARSTTLPPVNLAGAKPAAAAKTVGVGSGMIGVPLGQEAAPAQAVSTPAPAVPSSVAQLAAAPPSARATIPPRVTGQMAAVTPPASVGTVIAKKEFPWIAVILLVAIAAIGAAIYVFAVM